MVNNIEGNSFNRPALGAIGCDKVNYNINIFTEFAPVRAVVLGHMDESSMLPSNDPTFVSDSGDPLSQGVKYDPKVI